MKKIIIASSILLIIGVITIPLVFSDEDWKEYRQKSKGVASVTNPQYLEECGECHMAYQPGLLVSTSWQKIISNLDKHFGDNAELDKATSDSIKHYLIANSADKSNYRRSRKFMRQISSKDAPIRITQTPYFLHKHHEIPDRIVTANEKVKSFSHCNACHIRAEKGLYDEHDVRIPGYGHWDD